MPLLLDVNVWLPLHWDGHVAHRTAHAWAEGQSDDLWFCRVTQLAMLRHLTNPSILGRDVLTNSEAAQMMDAILAKKEISFHEDPPGITAIFPALGKAAVPTRNLWTDAYLASFAIAANIKFVTFDQGFGRFEPSGLKWQLLSHEESK